MSDGEARLRPIATRPAPALADLRLTAEEVAELTERLLEADSESAREAAIPLETYLAIFRSRHVPEEAIRTAVAELVERREQRLSSVLRRKADELERMLFGLLPKLDASFHSSARVALADLHPARAAPRGGSGSGEWIEYQIAADRGELEVRARHLTAAGSRHLFTLLVLGPRRPGRWRRMLGAKPTLPRQIRVLDPGGLRLEDLLAWTLSRHGTSPGLGRAVGFAFEALSRAVLGEVETAMGFVRELRFEGDGEP